MKEEKDKIEKDRARKKGVQVLKSSGILDAYDYLLDKLIQKGLPKGDLLEYSAVTIQKFEKKLKGKKAKELKDRIKQRENHALGLDQHDKKKKHDDTPERKPRKGESAK